MAKTDDDILRFIIILSCFDNSVTSRTLPALTAASRVRRCLWPLVDWLSLNKNRFTPNTEAARTQQCTNHVFFLFIQVLENTDSCLILVWVKIRITFITWPHPYWLQNMYHICVISNTIFPTVRLLFSRSKPSVTASLLKGSVLASTGLILSSSARLK